MIFLNTRMSRALGERNTGNRAILEFVEQTAAKCEPDRIFWCDGSAEERAALTSKAVEMGVLIELNQEKLPGCYYHRSNPNDVARMEKLTFICTEQEEEAGPTNNWMAPEAMDRKLNALLAGAMKGRTLYVVPYLMGPPGSPRSKVGV